MAKTYEEAVNLIKDRLDIVEVIGKRVILNKAGSNYVGLCPFHQDKKPSMSVSPQKGIYKCFSCGASGDAIKFIQDYEHKDFREVIQDLAEEFGIELPKAHSGTTGAQTKSLKSEMFAAYAKAVQFYTKTLYNSSDATTARTYLKSRDITDNIPSTSQAKAGDILCYDGHVEIYAGKFSGSRPMVWNCGSTSAIRSKSLITRSSKSKSKLTYILRVK